MFKKILTIIFLSTWWATATGQGVVRGRVVDSLTGQGLAFATVTVFSAADTAVITYRLSDPEGSFRVPGLPLNKECRILVSYSGYQVSRIDLRLADEKPKELGSILLTPVASTLDEILVHAERPPVRVFRDTIEFNAASFKTLPTALVEDLLRKLPGVQVDKLGNIMVNGQKVNRILVDGKSFFGDDPKMASRNLPANVIDKVQVMDDQLERNRITDGNYTGLGKVINLRLKKGVKKGWFGKAYAGGGTKETFEAGGIANIYRDTLQLSLLGFANNINRSGFSMHDVENLGGFNRSGYNSVEITKRGNHEGFALDGMSFGGLEEGVNRTGGAGFNLNHAPSGKQDFFIQYFINHTRNNTARLTLNQQFLHDTAILTASDAHSARNLFTHVAGIGTNLTPDSLTNLAFRANYRHLSGSGNLSSLIGVHNNQVGLNSTGDKTIDMKQGTQSYDHTVRFTRRSSTKEGRSLNLFNMLSYHSALEQALTRSLNVFYLPQQHDSVLFEQLRRQQVPGLYSSTRLSTAERLAERLTIRLSNYWELVQENQDITAFGRDSFSGSFTDRDPARSSNFKRKQNRLGSLLSLNWELGKVNLSAGIGALWQWVNNDYRSLAKSSASRMFNFLPDFSLSWQGLFLQYNQSVSPPSIRDLMPVPDLTNPFYIVYGNPQLQPVKQHNANLNFFKYYAKNQSNFSFNSSLNLIENDIIHSRNVQGSGVQSVVPVNVRQGFHLYINASYGREFRFGQTTQFSFRLKPHLMTSHRKLMVNENISSLVRYEGGPSLALGLNFNDKIEIRPDYSLSLFSTRYADRTFTNQNVLTHYLNNELVVRWPNRVVWESYLDYRFNNVVASGQPKNNVMLSAAVTLLMFKEDRGMIKLSVFDIFNRNNNLYRYAQENFVVDQRTNTLNRYFLLTYTYQFRNLGANKKAGGRERLFLF